MTRGVAILGSTGSIGTQALDVLSHHRDEYRVVALAAGANTELLARQADEFGVPDAMARPICEALASRIVNYDKFEEHLLQPAQ